MIKLRDGEIRLYVTDDDIAALEEKLQGEKLSSWENALRCVLVVAIHLLSRTSLFTNRRPT